MNVPSEKLQNTKYGTDEHINLIATRFDEAAKRTFRSSEELCLIQFGSVADQDINSGIRRGSLRLAGCVSTCYFRVLVKSNFFFRSEVMELFEPSITATINAVRAQKAESKRPHYRELPTRYGRTIDTHYPSSLT